MSKNNNNRKKRDRYQNLARELTKLHNIKEKVIPFVIGAFETIPKELVKELEDLDIRGQVETIQSILLLRSARILRKVQENCSHSNSIERPLAKAGVENSLRVKES